MSRNNRTPISRKYATQGLSGPAGRQRLRTARNPLALLVRMQGPSSRLAETPLPQMREWKECLGLALGFERSRAVLRHWSYDLNRHIALKNAQDRLIELIDRRS